jgi:hypothetical protein
MRTWDKAAVDGQSDAEDKCSTRTPSQTPTPRHVGAFGKAVVRLS